MSRPPGTLEARHYKSKLTRMAIRVRPQHAVRTKTNGGCDGDDFIGSSDGGCGVSELRRSRRSDRIEASPVNRLRGSSGRPQGKLRSRAIQLRKKGTRV